MRMKELSPLGSAVFSAGWREMILGFFPLMFNLYFCCVHVCALVLFNMPNL